MDNKIDDDDPLKAAKGCLLNLILGAVLLCWC